MIEFEPGQLAGAREFWDQEGFLVVRGVIGAGTIDRVVREYDKAILPSRDRFLQQSGYRYRRNDLSPVGRCRNSFLQVHKYRAYPDFQAAVLNVLAGEEMQRLLRGATRFPTYYLGQSMLFDHNTGTEAHQDDYYLDSVPNGQMVAAWVALEDIREEAGRFYVLRGTNRLNLTPKDENVRHSNELYLKALREWMAQAKYEMVAPALRKGDVMLWGSKILHGATRTTDQRLTRCSLTAHYIPEGFQFGNALGAVYPTELTEYPGMRVEVQDEIRGSWAGQMKHNWMMDLKEHWPRTFRTLRWVKRSVGKLAR